VERLPGGRNAENHACELAGGMTVNQVAVRAHAAEIAALVLGFKVKTLGCANPTILTTPPRGRIGTSRDQALAKLVCLLDTGIEFTGEPTSLA
jgi:hypothetical protein